MAYNPLLRKSKYLHPIVPIASESSGGNSSVSLSNPLYEGVTLETLNEGNPLQPSYALVAIYSGPRIDYYCLSALIIGDNYMSPATSFRIRINFNDQQYTTSTLYVDISPQALQNILNNLDIPTEEEDGLDSWEFIVVRGDLTRPEPSPFIIRMQNGVLATETFPVMTLIDINKVYTQNPIPDYSNFILSLGKTLPHDFTPFGDSTQSAIFFENKDPGLYVDEGTFVKGIGVGKPSGEPPGRRDRFNNYVYGYDEVASIIYASCSRRLY